MGSQSQDILWRKSTGLFFRFHSTPGRMARSQQPLDFHWKLLFADFLKELLSMESQPCGWALDLPWPLVANPKLFAPTMSTTKIPYPLIVPGRRQPLSEPVSPDYTTSLWWLLLQRLLPWAHSSALPKLELLLVMPTCVSSSACSWHTKPQGG